jgi:hypothetical protein
MKPYRLLLFLGLPQLTGLALFLCPALGNDGTSCRLLIPELRDPFVCRGCCALACRCTYKPVCHLLAAHDRSSVLVGSGLNVVAEERIPRSPRLLLALPDRQSRALELNLGNAVHLRTPNMS